MEDGGGSVDAALPCQRDEDGGCLPIQYAFTTSFPRAVDHHGTFIHDAPDAGAFLYVTGGILTRNAQATGAVYPFFTRARIGGDGFLGEWEELDPLPAPTAFHALTQHNGRVYMLAGLTQSGGQPSASRRTWVGTPDGLGNFAWVQGPQLPAKVRTHATAHVLGGKLHLVGGGNAAGTTLVTVAEVMTDGTLGAFADGAPLPRARSHHGAVEHQGRVYLVGGFDEDQAAVDVVHRSIPAADGSIAGWEVAGVLENPPWTPSVILVDNRIYVLGGGAGSDNLATVRVAPIQEDGMVGTFERLPNMPFARSHVHQAPVMGRRFYSVGGRSGRTFDSTDDVLTGVIR